MKQDLIELEHNIRLLQRHKKELRVLLYVNLALIIASLVSLLWCIWWIW